MAAETKPNAAWLVRVHKQNGKWTEEAVDTAAAAGSAAAGALKESGVCRVDLVLVEGVGPIVPQAQA